jgi:hypothetical protein
MRGFYVTLDRDTCKPFMDPMPVMLPMASWWRTDVELKRPPYLPIRADAVAIDTGSYVLAQSYADGYPYGFTVESIVRWIRGVYPPASWAVLPDWPCEGKSPEQVRDIQIRGNFTMMAILREHLTTVPWVWCPVLQGQTVEDYLRHAVELSDIIHTLRDYYAEHHELTHHEDWFRVCLGSICRRGQTSQIREIVEAVAAVLPGIRLHLFGVKLEVLDGWEGCPDTVWSVDSAAWNGRFGSDITRLTNDQRARGMTQREYTIKVRLPEYRRKVEQALWAPTTPRLFG